MAPVFVKRYGSGNRKKQVILPDDTDLTWGELAEYDYSATVTSKFIEHVLKMGEGKNLELGFPFNCTVKMVWTGPSLNSNKQVGISAKTVTWISKQPIKISKITFPISETLDIYSELIYNAIKDEGLKSLIAESDYTYLTGSFLKASTTQASASTEKKRYKIFLLTYADIYGDRNNYLEKEGTTQYTYNSEMRFNDYAYYLFKRKSVGFNTFEYLTEDERIKTRILTNSYGESVKYCTTTPDTTGITVSNYETYVPSKCLGIDENGNPCTINYSENNVHVLFGFSL